MSATCPCGLVSFKVLSTRDHDIPGVVLRRRECAEGHRWTTWEVSEAFISHVGRKASRDILFTISAILPERTPRAARAKTFSLRSAMRSR